MRGYFTFLVVFAACLLLISLAQFNTSAKTSDLGSAIWVERYYQVQINAKEAVVEAARQGAREGFFQYSEELAACAVRDCTPKCGALAVAAAPCFAGCVPAEIAGSYSDDCLQRKINSVAAEKINLLDGAVFDPEIKVSIALSAADTDTCTPCKSDKGPVSDGVVMMSYLPGANKFPDFDDENLYRNIALDELDESINDKFSSSAADITIRGDKITITLEHGGWDAVSAEMPDITEEMP